MEETIRTLRLWKLAGGEGETSTEAGETSSGWVQHPGIKTSMGWNVRWVGKRQRGETSI